MNKPMAVNGQGDNECHCFQCCGEPEVNDCYVPGANIDFAPELVGVPKVLLEGWLNSLEKVPLVEYQNDFEKMKSEVIDEMRAQNRAIAAEVRGFLL